ncbi:MAG: imidazolonepropionase [Flavobacteriaceae bacterium]|nr:imidazolonepropionase [Flavobacteriaceae bacterium]OUV87616.1 MAG: imidazolonepropionase [Flavobacteriaceae bacterium TMED145]|tara:strand:+ start:5708 stop:6940 length:1233 start_codon:yes stop_codon:yes gene_type:complete
MFKLIINIKELIQIRDRNISFISAKEMDTLPSINNAYLLIENGKISEFGKMSEISKIDNIETIDAKNKIVLPCWCDSHTHSVYTGNRSDEYVQRIKGVSYQEIANNGGGILKSSRQINSISEDELFFESKNRIEKLIKYGTGSLEIKTGYGLSYDGELKMLKVIKRLKESLPIQIKSTFLGAHAIPKNYKKEEYFRLVLEEMLPDFAKDELIDFVDIFCEKNYFSADDTKILCNKASELGIASKIHVNQFNSIGGVKVAVDCGALSVDHLEVINKSDINILKQSKTIPVLLPGCSFFLGIEYADAKTLLSNEIPFAIASDYNPGSSPSGNMNFILSLACNKLKLTTEQAINAATINGAYAMGLSHKTGSITKGKIANVIITSEIESINDLPYFYGDNLVDKILINGEEII